MKKKLFTGAAILAALLFVVWGYVYLLNPALQKRLDQKTYGLPPDKETVVAQFEVNGATLYLIGTIHDGHLYRQNNYSLAHLQSAVENIQPDVLMAEARPQTLADYNVVDGPVEMLFLWAMAEEKGIPAVGVDAWAPGPGAYAGTSSNGRENAIYANIRACMEANPSADTFLVFLGASHIAPMTSRLHQNGYTQTNFTAHETLYGGVPEEDFQYPAPLGGILERRIAYYDTGFPQEIAALNEVGSESYAYWMGRIDTTVTWHEGLLPLFAENQLYFE